MNLDDFDGYLSVRPECELTTPAGFSNLLCQYILPFEMEAPPPGTRARSAAEKENPIGGLFYSSGKAKELPAALGQDGFVLAARGVADMPSCDAEDFLRLVASGESWSGGGNARRNLSYSLNTAYASSNFAMRHKWMRRAQGECAALFIAALPRRSIISWGGDSESGPFTEAEVLVKPATNYGQRGFILGKRLPYRKCDKATRLEFALGHYIEVSGKDANGYNLEFRLHPEISKDSMAALKHYDFRMKLITVPDTREWYEVDL